MRIRLLIAGLVMSMAVSAQHHHDAPFKEDDIMVLDNFKKAYPELADKVDAEEAKLEAFTQNFIANYDANASRSDVDYIIPVVFHILHEDGPENVSNAEIYDAMRILNEDFQKTNADTADVVNGFKNIIGDAKIEFRLARKDPNGNPTNGIDRIRSSLTNNAGEGSKLNTWPRSTYLNIWIVKSIGSGAAGYTFLPSTAQWRPNQDGIILLYTYFASIRTGTARRSRALTHEIGHWLNLPHPWGRTNNPGLASNCSDDDGVWDTPNTVGWTSCSLNGTSCGSLDNVQNYMDYSYCSNMFTNGQVARMHAALNSRTAQRRDLVSEVNNRKAGVLDLELADFASNKNHACVNEFIQFEDKSIYDAVSWSWEFEKGIPATSSMKNPVVMYNTPGEYKVKLTVTDALGNKRVIERMNYIVVNRSVGSFLPYEEGFESASESVDLNWVVENEDDDNVYWQVKQGVSYEGDNSLYLENTNNTFGQVEGVISAPVDLSNILNPELSFYMAHASKPGANGGSSKFRVLFSKDCGETWTIKYVGVSSVLSNGNQQNSPFVPSSQSDWRKITVSTFLNSDRVQNGLIKFEVENGFDNNFYIDNINIDGVYATEPVLEFPVNGMDSVSSSVYLDWKAVPVIDKYEYQLAEDAQFTQIVSTGTKDYINPSPNNEDTRFLATNLTSGKTYYWRVLIHRGAITSNWSEVWSFTVSRNGVGHEFLDGLDKTTSVNSPGEIEKLQVRVFPNPSKGQVNIHLENGVSDEETQVEIYSVHGQLVWSQSAVGNSEFYINENELSPGMYVINVSHGNSVTSQKLIIQ